MVEKNTQVENEAYTLNVMKQAQQKHILCITENAIDMKKLHS